MSNGDFTPEAWKALQKDLKELGDTLPNQPPQREEGEIEIEIEIIDNRRRDNNSGGVIATIQEAPAVYRILLETGFTIVLPKTLLTKLETVSVLNKLR